MGPSADGLAIGGDRAKLNRLRGTRRGSLSLMPLFGPPFRTFSAIARWKTRQTGGLWDYSAFYMQFANAHQSWASIPWTFDLGLLRLAIPANHSLHHVPTHLEYAASNKMFDMDNY